MPKLPALTSRKILALLKKVGFEVDHITGSHHILFNKETGKRVVVPFHTRDLPKGTLHTIFRSAGLSINDLL